MKRLITYVNSVAAKSVQFRPGSRWKILYEDPGTCQRAILVEWDPGYRMGQVDYHESDEIIFVLSGTFVQNNRVSRPGTYIHQRAGSKHQAHTPDGCTFLEIVTGQRPVSRRVTRDHLALFRRLVRPSGNVLPKGRRRPANGRGPELGSCRHSALTL